MREPNEGRTVNTIVSVSGLDKRYSRGQHALKSINLEIKRAEIFALLGPNGAGKTTLIGIICGLIRPTAGSVTVDGHDVVRDYRAARAKIGLVPQELATDLVETVWDTVTYSRGLFGKAPDPAHLERLLRDLSLWERRRSEIMALSGGMKRRVLIAKALAHEPRILFLDEPTAGVDVELRRDMWGMLRLLRDQGVTIVLTTHYLDEAEEMADRIGIIDKGELVLIEEKRSLMQKLGQTEVTIGLKRPLAAVPADLAAWPVGLSNDGLTLSLTARGHMGTETGVSDLLKQLLALGIDFKSVSVNRSSLEDVFLAVLGERS